MELKNLFQRKRPPVYVWNDVWEPNVIVKSDFAAGEGFSWTCDDDHYYHILSVTYSFTTFGLAHNVIFYGTLDIGQHRLFNWGHRNWNQSATLVQCDCVVNTRSLVATANDRSYNDLPDHVYATPGMVLTQNCIGLGLGDNYNYVAIYARRWSLR